MSNTRSNPKPHKKAAPQRESDPSVSQILASLPNPVQIKAYLDQYVIGQDEAKKVLAVAVYNHYKKILNNTPGKELFLDKSNVILMGDTGCGKTLLVKSLARLLNVPYYIQDCTKMTASGYVGEDVENCLVGLLQACDYDIEMAQMGIIMLDEGDKLFSTEAGPSITRDVGGTCVQQSLLKIVEGSRVGVQPQGGRKHPEQPLLYVDTSNILFILSGAFVGIDNIIKKRLGKKKVGFATEDKADTVVSTPKEYITPQDVRDFGFIPEFVGRFPVITYVDKLTEDDLIRVIKEPKNSILKQYTALLAMDNVKLKFTDGALHEIARLAVTLGAGARGLRSIMEVVMTDIMFEAPDKAALHPTITVTEELVRKTTAKKFPKN